MNVKYHACSRRFRVYYSSYRKADAIYTNQQAVEAFLYNGHLDHNCIVREYLSNTKGREWLVSWMGDHFKWDQCFCESDR